MTALDRRLLIAGASGLGFLLPAAAGAAPRARGERQMPVADAAELGMVPNAGGDQTAALQQAIDKAAERNAVLALPPGRYGVRTVMLRPGSHLTGPGATLAAIGDGPLLGGQSTAGVVVRDIALDGGSRPLAGDRAGLVRLTGARGVVISDLDLTGSRSHGLVLEGCSGRIETCRISGMGQAGIFSIDAAGGVEIRHNTVTDCANNGILVWRTAAGEDGSIVAGNRIERIGAAAGGSGQNGNGVNVFRAGNVLVQGNHIADCAYSAVRGNTASDIQIVANQARRIGEVALYAEFGFEGALIASNLVDTAATGVSVTNFNEGGRLAVVQGNLIRNLVRREHEPQDKRGEGIAVEADAMVSGNTIENAATVGILLGWGRYMRDVSATGNVIRNARVGIMVTREPEAGAALIAQNLISGARDGAIRAMDKGVALGPDLAVIGTQSKRIRIDGNHAVA